MVALIVTASAIATFANHNIKINIEIMRAFSRYRALLTENKDLKSEIRALDDKINKVFKFLLEKIDALHQKEIDKPKRKQIGYKSYDKDK